VPERASITATEAPLTVEIPTGFAVMREGDPALAREWQLALREAMQRAFAAGYVAMDFLRESAETHPRARYLLRRPAA
jgi:predicted GNAT superfamily acetyltransferase